MQAPKLEGVIVELHQDAPFAPQLVMANHSGKLLEILDDDGRAFLRISPRGAEGDLAAEAFHRSRISGGDAVAKDKLSGKPRWRQLSAEPSYGWFDPRIATGPIEIPAGVRNAGGEMPFGEWSIPLRLGGENKALAGYFVYLPPAQGRVVSVLVSPMQLAPGISVQLAPGSVPAIMLTNKTAQEVSVLDSTGQPFLRIGPKGTLARLDSPDWRAANADAPREGRGWQTVSKARNYVWLEPRARYSDPAPAQTQPARLGEWTVPLVVAGAPLALRGAWDWQPAPKASKK